MHKRIISLINNKRSSFKVALTHNPNTTYKIHQIYNRATNESENSIIIKGFFFNIHITTYFRAIVSGPGVEKS